MSMHRCNIMLRYNPRSHIYSRTTALQSQFSLFIYLLILVESMKRFQRKSNRTNEITPNKPYHITQTAKPYLDQLHWWEIHQETLRICKGTES
jgi:hypothetical protein